MLQSEWFGFFQITMKSTISSSSMALILFSALTASAAQHFVSLNNPTPASPFTSWATAATNIQDAVNAAVAGDEVVVSNGVYQTGAAAIYGMSNRMAVTKALYVHSVNGSVVTIIKGYQVSGTTNGPAAVRCAYLTNGVVLAGFTLTGGATQNSGDNFQQQSGGGVWCESVSTVVSNCVLTGNSAAEDGGGAFDGSLNNCALMANSASYGGGSARGALNNCTLTANSASVWGGGTFLGTLTNCALEDNSASSGGGGAMSAVLQSCVLRGNSADQGGAVFFSLGFPACYNCLIEGNFADEGGGVYFDVHTYNEGGGLDGDPCDVGTRDLSGAIYNCTLTENIANFGGGIFEPYYSSDGRIDHLPVVNCIIYYNADLGNGNYGGIGRMDYCCTTPMPLLGIGNFTDAPGFVSAYPGNFRLSDYSPCINAGVNSNTTYYPSESFSGTNDLDGNPRIRGGTVDVGAYEYQNPTSVISYAWLYEYGLWVDGSDDFADSDGDGMNNWQEWIAGTDPTNATSLLRLYPPMVNDTGIQLTWSSVETRTYILERATNLALPSAFSDNIPYNYGVVGSDTNASWTDTSTAGDGPFFYRVRVVGPAIGYGIFGCVDQLPPPP
jgi:hypothetical protein